MSNLNDKTEFGLEILISELYKVRYIIAATMLIVGVLSYSISLFIPNYYSSEAILFPRADNEESQEGGLSSISNVVGIDLGRESLSKVDISLEFLISRKFITGFIKKHQILIDLFAADGWNLEDKSIIYDNEIYDVIAKKWVRDVKLPKTVVPSDWEAYEAFLDILQVEENSEGFVIISIESKAPTLSQKWLSLIIEDINGEMKIRDQANLEKSLAFLNEKIAETSNANIRDIFYSLIEDQTRKMMMTESNSDYVLEILDPPVEAVTPIWPNRLLILVLSMIATLVVSIFVVLIRLSIKLGKIN